MKSLHTLISKSKMATTTSLTTSTIPVAVPEHWVSKFGLADTTPTFDLLKAIDEYESEGGKHCRVDVVPKSDTIFAFRINHIYQMARGICMLFVTYITSDFRVCITRVSRYTDERSIDWEVAKEIAKYLGLSEEEWREPGRIEEILL
jgi:hypothetical protein